MLMTSRRKAQRGFLRKGEWLVIAAIAGCLTFSVVYQNSQLTNMERQDNRYRQKLKLPSAQALKFLTVGYDNIYADWLWLQSIQAFGSGWMTEDGTTRPIFQYFDTLTDVDPKFISAYRFANLIIADNRFDYDLGQEILRKGTIKNPNNYDVPYLGMYNGIFAMNDTDEARWFARRLQGIRNAPAFMKRMEEYIERKDGRWDIALEHNIRYYLEYLINNNDLELDIIQRRMIDVADRTAKAALYDATLKYMEDHNGEHPSRIEELVNIDYLPQRKMFVLPNFQPAMEAHADRIDVLDPNRDIPEDLVDSIREASSITIAGLPPEPQGTWYYIWGHSRDFYLNDEEFTLEGLDTVPYIRSAWGSIRQTNDWVVRGQGSIMAYLRENDKKPDSKLLEKLEIPDPLGGHYRYDPDDPASPETGTFRSTGAQRVTDNRDPRLGAMGLGPFPMPLEPRLHDNTDELLWAISRGYADLMGNEFYESLEGGGIPRKELLE